jgi:outer membrane protein
MKLLNTLSATLLATHGLVAFAASGPDHDGGPPPTLGLGLGAVVSSTVYAGEDRRIRPVPFVSYESERFFWRGIGGGVHLVDRDGFSLDATLSARLGGIKRKDFGAGELARRGVNRDLLDDRDDGLDLGIAATWGGDLGELEAGLKADATGASKGYEASLKYGYPMQLGGTRITPHAGVSLMSKKLSNYYFGTHDAEVARGVVNYKPGSAAVPSIGVDVVHPLSGKWIILGGLSYKILPTKITDSPLLKKDTNGSVSLVLGVSRGF